MDNRNTYSMPAPWGGIILWEENGELARICPTIDSIQEPSPAPQAIADVMQQLEAVLSVPQATSEELRETLLERKPFANCRNLRAVCSTSSAALNRGNG